MKEADNIQIVQRAYAAFGRGDVPAMLADMTDDIDWHGVIGVGPNVPTGGPRHGKNQVALFFKQVSETVDFKKFEPQQFLAQGETVVVLGHYTGSVKTTGRTFSLDWVMVFTLHGGKVARFREYTDGAAVTAAY
jgi:ketosteroid isomerase-like protein